MNITTKPIVSIGMPVYNGEKFICEALASLLAQTFTDFELIISDNASSDQTPRICEEYAARDKRIRYYRSESTSDPISNFNRVLEMVRGDYFMWAAADDLWEPAYVFVLLQALTSEPDTVLAFSDFNNINEHGHEVKTYPHVFQLQSANPFQRLRNYLIQDEHLGKANLIYGLMRRSTIQTAGGFNVWGKSLWGADMLVVFRLLSLGNLILTRELLFHKRLVLPSDLTHKGKFIHLATRISQFYSTFREWHGYFCGYACIIGIAECLTVNQKAKLQVALWMRASQLYLKVIKKALIISTISLVTRSKKCM